jgi:hypothetical protein
MSSDYIFYLINSILTIVLLYPEIIDKLMIDINVIIFIIMDESKNLSKFLILF